MLGRFPFLIRENQQRGSQFGGLGVLRPSGGVNAVAGCWWLRGVISHMPVSGQLRAGRLQIHNHWSAFLGDVFFS